MSASFYPYLTFNPASLECGAIATGTTGGFALELKNEGYYTDLVIESLSSSDGQVVLTGVSLPITIPPFSSVTIGVEVTPGGVGAGSASIDSTSNAINNPVSCAVSWTGVAAGVVALTVDPPTWLFDNQKIGTTSSEVIFTIRNTGTVAVTVNAPTYPANFNAGGTLPAYPVVVGVGGTLAFGVRFAPTVSAGFVEQNVLVNSTAAATPFTLTLSGMGFLITPAYSVNSGLDSFLFAFALDASIAVQEMDSTSFDTETEALWRKLHNFALLGVDKVLCFFWYHYENIGVVEVTFTFTNDVDGTTLSVVRTVGSGGADGKLKLDSFELDPPLEGENILLEVLKSAGDGSFQLVDYGFRFQPETELIGTRANSKSITPAFIASGEELLMFAFQNVAQQMDSEDFECEAAAGVSNTLMMPFQTDAGVVPGFVYEKGVYRVYFRYENYGVAVVDVTVVSMRGQIEHQVVSIGTVAADGKIAMGVADIAVSDEVHTVVFEKVSGPLFIVDYVVKYELQAERKKD